jgi:molybdopterin converting factor small subunit
VRRKPKEVNTHQKTDPIRVKINTTFAVGNTQAFASQFNEDGELVLELPPGTTVQRLLERLPAIGASEDWSDLFLHVFINHRSVGFDHLLRSGDVIDIHIPLSGG